MTKDMDFSTLPSINEAQDEVIDEFSDFDDWMDRYQLLIDLGNELDALDDKYKTQDNLIDGCQSRVWVQCDLIDGRMVLTADSDALIVKGIIALLIKVLSGHTPKEILDTVPCRGRLALRHHRHTSQRRDPQDSPRRRGQCRLALLRAHRRCHRRTTAARYLYI